MHHVVEIDGDLGKLGAGDCPLGSEEVVAVAAQESSRDHTSMVAIEMAGADVIELSDPASDPGV